MPPDACWRAGRAGANLGTSNAKRLRALVKATLLPALNGTSTSCTLPRPDLTSSHLAPTTYLHHVPPRARPCSSQFSRSPRHLRPHLFPHHHHHITTSRPPASLRPPRLVAHPPSPALACRPVQVSPARVTPLLQPKARRGILSNLILARRLPVLQTLRDHHRGKDSRAPPPQFG